MEIVCLAGGNLVGAISIWTKYYILECHISSAKYINTEYNCKHGTTVLSVHGGTGT
jgi:hypothetical protein